MSGHTKKKPVFQLGDQPDWANTEPAKAPAPGFIEELLGEDPAVALLERGYCLAKLDAETQSVYHAFHEAFQCFSKRDKESKAEFAITQFSHARHSPNQYHGFSMVSGLKEQFMMRLGGKGTDLPFPNDQTSPDSTLDFGISGTQLFIKLDQFCRQVAHDCMCRLGLPNGKLDAILDPIFSSGPSWTASRSRTGQTVTTSYVPPGYVSSSIMDNFHYRSWELDSTPPGDLDARRKTEGGEGAREKNMHTDMHTNNHSSHTDSGLLTAVVCTDEPALEVFDSKLGHWIALEVLIHQYVRESSSTGQSAQSHSHREFVSLFWGDSAVYLADEQKTPSGHPLPQPCLHRVEKSSGERFSVVFKQRTTPTKTAPRYQEDYELAELQLRALAHSNPGRDQIRKYTVVASCAAVVALAVAFWRFR